MKNAFNNLYELVPVYDARQSFYRKAFVHIDGNGNKQLYSYKTLVAEIKDGVPKLHGKYSQTTTRHQKEFLKQEGFTDNEIKTMFKNAA